MASSMESPDSGRSKWPQPRSRPSGTVDVSDGRCPLLLDFHMVAVSIIESVRVALEGLRSTRGERRRGRGDRNPLSWVRG